MLVSFYPNNPPFNIAVVSTMLKEISLTCSTDDVDVRAACLCLTSDFWAARHCELTYDI